QASLFGDVPDGPFSLNVLFDRALAEGRLFGLPLKGLWLTVGTPDAITEAEQALLAAGHR
ncbi:MAG: nucleotidyltransferase family protein, partial [Devosiaceae bacterium]|nr:nucleotidyltransferase family protein [Devosiaceae bacterium MH13]